MRILVTGSRDWPFPEMVWRKLDGLYRVAEDRVTLVHGACPTGADAHADEWATAKGDVEIERYHADWATYGRGAGPRRNQLMVDLGADICLAFILNDSRVAGGCMRMAMNAEIPVDLEVATNE
jgi:hypothetical protein